jgi:hypothetical protein
MQQQAGAAGIAIPFSESSSHDQRTFLFCIFGVIPEEKLIYAG